MAKHRSALRPSVSGPQSRKRYFTVSEANRALTLVRKIAKDIVNQYHRVVDQQEQVERLECQCDGEAARGQRDRLAEEAQRLQRLIAELKEVGMELKDPSIGLLDFPAQHQGRDIHLCWKLGENDVAHWHELDAGYAGRQPVDELE